MSVALFCYCNLAFAAAVLDMTGLYRVHALPVVIFVVLMAIWWESILSNVRDYAVAGACSMAGGDCG